MNPVTPLRRASPRRSSPPQRTPERRGVSPLSRLQSSPYQRRSPRLEEQTRAQVVIAQPQVIADQPQALISSHDPLIKLTVDVRLKDTVNQRLTSSGRMGTHKIYADTWDDVKSKLWSIVQVELKPLAIPTGKPPVWKVDEQEPTIDLFEKYTSMRINAKVLDPWGSAKDRRYLTRNEQETILLSVYKYGNEISTVAQFTDFEEQCIHPVETDRGGAANEAVHQSLITALKEKWGAILTAQELSWRLWAGSIVKKPRTQHEREIAKPPPSNMVNQFRWTANSSDEHMQRVQRSVKMAKKVVQGMQSKVQMFSQSVQVLQSAIASMNEMLENQLEVIVALGEDVAIAPDTTEVSSALTAIPNQDDIDHE
ncbi:hypothetical protein P43SY_001264 [Pythium insidiosum]|uniref:Uncharacterized protein n=1 Tax=Pythium insidiosum TaxID=114742 RepID=A0AAD5LX79_PYTIN|nr:hypothetical protein P43SY_001264 [Pythium insidiosum]